jgi:GNAT superfamily N-acetyltransferase
MIRRAVDDDLDRLVEMGLRFHTETSYRDHVKANPQQMRTLAKQLADLGGLLVSTRSEKVVGMIGYVLFPHFLSCEMVAGEVFWWVEPEHRGEGIKLLREAEKRAKSAGAVKMQMIAPDGQVANIYQRLGYEFVESAYQRNL